MADELLISQLVANRFGLHGGFSGNKHAADHGYSKQDSTQD
jgi:hypothetical protein